MSCILVDSSKNLANVYFQSKELAHLAKQSPGMIYFILSEKTVVVLVAHDLEAGEFVAQVPYFPPSQARGGARGVFLD